MPVRNEAVPISSSSPERRRRSWNAVAFGLTLVLLLGGYQAAVQTAYPVRRMPDGANVGLVGVTYQNPQAVLVGSPWDQLLAACRGSGTGSDWKVSLPGGLSPTAWLNYSRSYFWRDPRAPVAVLRSPSGDEWFAEYDTASGRLKSPVGALEGQSFPVFPRRHRQLTLRVYQTAGGWLRGPQQWVDFSFPNPAYRAYPTWTPEPFPCVRRSGDLQFELTSLRTGVDFPAGSAPTPLSYLAATFATFRITRNGVRDPQWEPIEITYLDATGNHLGGYEDRLTRNGEEIGFPLHGQLPSDERAWKVRAEFTRLRAKGARPNYLWTAHHVPIPPYNDPFTWQSTPLAPGVTLQMQRMNAPDSNGVQLNLQLQRQGWKDLRVVLRGVDDMGYTFSDKDADWKETRGGEMPRWQIYLPLPARFIDLRLSAFRSRSVEFLAQPTRVR